MNNPFSINPKQILQSMMSNNSIMQNPIAKNAIELYQKGDTESLNQMAKNLCKERGLDADQVVNELKTKFKL